MRGRDFVALFGSAAALDGSDLAKASEKGSRDVIAANKRNLLRVISSCFGRSGAMGFAARKRTCSPAGILSGFLKQLARRSGRALHLQPGQRAQIRACAEA